MNKKFMILSIAVALLVVATITISSYAYFTISNKEGEESAITSGTMSLLFTDGNEISANNLLPGQSIEKEFTVKNTGNLDTIYDVYLSDVINNFADRTDLVYELTSTDGGYNTTSQVEVPNRSAKIVNEQSIGVNDIHHYKLKITFLNKDENQDDNQGKVFSAKIQINEYKDIEINTNYYLDNELVNEMPNSNYNYINSTCDKNAEVLFDDVNWNYDFINVTQNNTTCNLYFEIPSYTLTYNYNYSGSISTNKTIKYGQSYGMLPQPERSGYEFIGWWTDSENGTEVNSSNTIAGDTIIYAHWNKTIGPSLDSSQIKSSASVVQKGVKGVVYLAPNNLNIKCNASNSTIGSGSSGCMKWYIYDDTGSNYKMILDHNAKNNIVWNSSNKNVAYNQSGAATAIRNLGWDSSLQTTIMTAAEVNAITGKQNLNLGDWTAWYYLDDPAYYQNPVAANKGAGASAYAWLFDYTYNCEGWGCSTQVTDGSIAGYWLQDTLGNPSSAANVWHIFKNGNIGTIASKSQDQGIRPVITISKSNVA